MNMDEQKGLINIILVVIGVIILAGTAGYFILSRQAQKPLIPVIERISPVEAPIGVEISIIGSGFASIKNSLQFDPGFAYLNNLASSDGKIITFVLPESFDTCNPDGSVCAEFLGRPIPGQTYEVAVININGKSNSMNFTVAPEGGVPTPTPTPTPTKPSPVPAPVPSSEKIIKKVGEQEGSFLIQKINPDSIDGLWYLEYPIPREKGEPRTLRIGDDIGYACEGVSEKLININFPGQTITFNKVIGQPPYGGCPICLAGSSLIDTPSGLIAVKDLQIGMLVWTTNKTGQRISGVIIRTSKVPVPPTHRMVHLVLSDDRDLFASPGHSTIDGRTIGDLVSGELYDGVSVVSTERVSYDNGATYDILPSGSTGFYWANGILIGSTLR